MLSSSNIMAAAGIAAISAAASADITRVDEFSSLSIEGFQDLTMSTFESGSVDVFGGLGTVLSASDAWVHTTGAWVYEQRVQAYEGDLMLGSSHGGIKYQFDVAQRSFGGYFASISDTADGMISFYSNGSLVGVDSLVAPTDTSWAWNGWSSDTAFDSVVISSNHSRGGFIMHDSVRVMFAEVPTPGTGGLLFGSMLVIARRRRR